LPAPSPVESALEFVVPSPAVIDDEVIKGKVRKENSYSGQSNVVLKMLCVFQ